MGFLIKGIPWSIAETLHLAKPYLSAAITSSVSKIECIIRSFCDCIQGFQNMYLYMWSLCLNFFRTDSFLFQEQIWLSFITYYCGQRVHVFITVINVLECSTSLQISVLAAENLELIFSDLIFRPFQYHFKYIAPFKFLVCTLVDYGEGTQSNFNN